MAVKRTKKKTAKQTAQGGAEVQKLPAEGSMPAEAPRVLDALFAPLAAMASMALAMSALVAVIIYLVTHRDLATWMTVTAIVKIAFLAGLCGVGVAMLRSRAWAQQTLLTVWLLVMAYSAVILLFYLMWGTPVLWEESLDWPLLAIILPAMICSAAATVLLVMASASKSRMRYASIVAVSVVVAITLAVGANMICQRSFGEGGFGYREEITEDDDDELDKDHGVSDRTARICKGVKDDIKLTCVYLYPEDVQGLKAEKAKERHDRIWEYLENLKKLMATFGRSIEIADVTTPAEQIKLLADLRTRSRKAQSAHVKILTQDFGGPLVKAFWDLRDQWRKMSDDAFVVQFVETADVINMLGVNAIAVEKVARAIRDAEDDTSALPDYPALAEDLTTALTRAQNDLKQIGSLIRELKDIPEMTAKSQKDILAAMVKAREAIAAMTKTVDGVAEGKVKPDQAAAVLAAFAKAAPVAAEEIRMAADKLRLAAGQDKSGTLRNSRYFMMAMVVLRPDGQRLMLRRGELVTNLEQIMAPSLDQMGQMAQQMAKVLKPDAQLESLKAVAEGAKHWAVQFDLAQAGTAKALAGMSKPDQETIELFKQAELLDKYFSLIEPDSASEGPAPDPPKVDAKAVKALAQSPDGAIVKGLLEPVRAILDAAEKLPDVDAGDVAVSKDVYEENIVVVEVGQKAKVATFDEVFPPQQRIVDRPGQATGDRAFHGDAAIASKMLKMGTEPFGTVVITYFEPEMFMPPPQLARMTGGRPIPRGELPIPPSRLGQLQEAIEEANYKLDTWNLADAYSEPKGDNPKPEILLILPPPRPSPMAMNFGAGRPGFGRDQIAQLRQRVNSGANAIFLMTYQPDAVTDRSGRTVDAGPETVLYEYLENDWGTDVLRDARVILTNPAEGDSFKINLQAWQYLPINTFTEHVIGDSLTDQRVFWVNACPIGVAGDPAQSILATIKTMSDDATEKKDFENGPVLSGIQAEIDKARKGNKALGVAEILAIIEQVKAKADQAGPGEIEGLIDRAKQVVAESGAEAKPDGIVTMIRSAAGQAKAMQRVETDRILRAVLAAIDKAQGNTRPSPMSPPPAPKDVTPAMVLAMLEVARQQKPLEVLLATARGALAGQGITRQSVLTVPDGVDNVWASRKQIRALVIEIESSGGLVKPSYGGATPDVPTPMDLAVAAVRESNAKAQLDRESRIVVLSVSSSFSTGYLSQPIGVADGKGGFSFEPPPRLNTTLVTNGLHWLTGNIGYIAARPEPEVKPVITLVLGDEPEEEQKRTVLKVMCLAGFPLAVLGIGGLVMFFRRR